jgi:hypothetical protein
MKASKVDWVAAPIPASSTATIVTDAGVIRR